LVKNYRVAFETFYAHRYTLRTASSVDLMPYVVPFLKALGFHHEGPRRIDFTQDQWRVLSDACMMILVWRKNTSLNVIERRCAASLAATAMLFTLGHNETASYLDIEREAVLQFKADIGYIRLCAKEAFSLLMSRFDQYLTCSPITPIYWSATEQKLNQKKRDALEEAREWVREILENRKTAAHDGREGKRDSSAPRRTRLYAL
jgi:hypothetical protein